MESSIADATDPITEILMASPFHKSGPIIMIPGWFGWFSIPRLLEPSTSVESSFMSGVLEINWQLQSKKTRRSWKIV
jgi:hypothetical protein